MSFLWPDEAVWFSLIGRGVSFVSTPITLLLVATRFSAVYQGFYYTFTTITSFTVLLELGLGMVLTQFASHEFAHLRWTPEGALDGPDLPRNHLLGILLKAVQWYTAVAAIAVLVFLPAGYAFFASQAHAQHVVYLGPWVALVVLTSLGLMAVPLVSTIEGCGRVADVARLRLLQSAAASILLWWGILRGDALYAAALAAAAPVVIPGLWLAVGYRGLLRQAWGAVSNRVDAMISWRRELLPMQWRIAVSWLGGFLVFSLFNPLLFRYQGAVAAGQMGMSLTLANAPFAIGMSWLATRAPLYGALIRQRRYATLDHMASTATAQAAIVWALGSGALLVAVTVARSVAPALAARVLPVSAVAALCVASLVNVLMQSMAGYLRAHKEEPYAALSVGTGVLVALTLWTAARFGSPSSMAFVYAGIVLMIELPIATIIFVRKRREWHRAPDSTLVPA